MIKFRYLPNEINKSIFVYPNKKIVCISIKNSIINALRRLFE
jgi:effector-binding domain-containing protein